MHAGRPATFICLERLVADRTAVIIRLTAKTISARAHELRKANKTMQLAIEQGRKVIVQVPARVESSR